MINDLFFVAIGLVVGWFFLPSPAWARDLISKVPYIGGYVRKD